MHFISTHFLKGLLVIIHNFGYKSFVFSIYFNKIVAMKILLFRDIVNYDKEAEINERGEEKEKK